MASVMDSDGETEEDVSADLTSVLNEDKVRPKNPSSRRKEVVDAKERSSIGDLNNFLSNFNDQVPNRLPTKFKSVSPLNYNIKWYIFSLAYFICKARIVESLSQKAKMAGTICLALAAAKKLNRSPASLRCKPATNKRMKAIGRVDVPQEAFMALKLEKEINAAKSAGRAVLSSRLLRFFGNFVLRVPVPRPGKVLGLVGTNCILKSTALQILAGKIKPNLGRYNGSSAKTGKSPRFDWNKLYWEIYSSPNLGQEKSNQTLADTIILLIGMKFGSLPWIRTSKLFHPSCRRETKGMCYEATTCGCYEKSAKGTLGMVLEKLDERGMMSEICDAMDLNHHVLDREATQVSGGELQRFSIAAVCLKKPDIYVFNKPFNFLDVRHRLRAAEVICSLLKHDKFGSMISLPTAYGVVTLPFSVREGINVFLAGFVPTENLRFRDESLNFKIL
ncbi:BnaC01g19920D [Brassica napus]|uniref:BnaC01g19920D protein n=1 Tax=Brassica napus TaxID=3708 RepID=A0A078HPS1_BRANA|nr:BnaC01g19920D [Brassica napus]